MFSFIELDTSSGVKANHQATNAHRDQRCADGATTGGNLLSMLLLISAVLGVLPLLGVVWILLTPMRATVDGLFMSLILLTISGIFTLNIYCEYRARGLLTIMKQK